MKIYHTLIAFLIVSYGFSQNKPSEVFAKIEGDNLVIVGDTLKLKARVSQLLYADLKEKSQNLSIHVGKNQTFGEKHEDYYFVLMQDKMNNVSIAKWLEKVGNNLLLIDDFNGENYWQVLTTVCIGKDDCTPEVAIIDLKKSWVCGHKLMCGIGEDCKKISAIETE